MSIDADKARRKVEVASAIFDTLSCGMDIPYTLLDEAHELGLSIEAIQEKVDELYGDEEDSDNEC